MRYHHDEIRRHHTESGFDMVRGTLVPNGEAPEVIADNVAFTRSFSAHLSDTVSWGHFLFAPGARLEVFDATLFDHLGGPSGSVLSVVPLLGVGAVYSFDFGLSVLAGVQPGLQPSHAGAGGGAAGARAQLRAGLSLRAQGGALRGDRLLERVREHHRRVHWLERLRE